MSGLAAVVLDLGGTLSDHPVSARHALDAWLVDRGVTPTEELAAAWSAVHDVTTPRPEAFLRVCQALGPAPGQVHLDRLGAGPADEPEPIEGLRDLVRHLAGEG